MSEQAAQFDQVKKVFEPALAAAQKQFQIIAQAQQELADKAADINRHWADRGRHEAHTASELASRLASAHSVPEAVTAWQEWGKERLERMTEDGKHLVADFQEIMKAGAAAFSKAQEKAHESGSSPN